MKPMRCLLLQLPLGAPAPAAVYGVATWDVAAPEAKPETSSAPLALLPPATRQTEVVALVPAAALSWHRVTLPAGLGHHSAKLQAALQGLLEDRLLQEPQQLHLALAPQWRAGSPAWVAACDKAWLQAHLHTLREAGWPVQRIVPEFAPPASGQRWHALGDEASGWLWCCDAEQGVSGWPVAAAAQLPSSWWANATLEAEPGLARWAQSRGLQPPALTDTRAHWPAAARGDWNLAQFDLQSDARTRQWQSLRRGVDALARQPQWRPARWGLAALLLSQLIGLQAWAWMTRQHWQAEQDTWTQMLQHSFPKVGVVIDAPLQMARELARLRQASGQLTAQDFEAQLHALGSALPQGVAAPARLDYQNGQLRWPTLALNAQQQSAFEQALQSQGLRLRDEGGMSRLQALEATP
jgi:general secretion pathway protein L